jgi:hypothetical protein
MAPFSASCPWCDHTRITRVAALSVIGARRQPAPQLKSNTTLKTPDQTDKRGQTPDTDMSCL